ncbi:MAG: T9SS type A sorting domain-containing protein [Phaeodactylibacter sp.]|nr:T9SS type A sorting domain-containing protein [Phaeodactylibacter sp.]
MELFPNPTANRIQLLFGHPPTGPIQIRLIAADSRMLYKTFDWETAVQSVSIDLSGLPQGLYFVEVRSADAAVVKRVLKL